MREPLMQICSSPVCKYSLYSDILAVQVLALGYRTSGYAARAGSGPYGRAPVCWAAECRTPRFGQRANRGALQVAKSAPSA